MGNYIKMLCIFAPSLVWGSEECLQNDSLSPWWKWNTLFLFCVRIPGHFLLIWQGNNMIVIFLFWCQCVYLLCILVHLLFFYLGTRSVYVAPDTAVYCRCVNANGCYPWCAEGSSPWCWDAYCLLYLSCYIILKTSPVLGCTSYA